jgi:hypothetical protein
LQQPVLVVVDCEGARGRQRLELDDQATGPDTVHHAFPVQLPAAGVGVAPHGHRLDEDLAVALLPYPLGQVTAQRAQRQAR